MNTQEFIESFTEFKDFKNIDRVTMMNIVEDVFRSVIARQAGGSDNYDIIINPDKGDLEVWHNRVIVPDGEVEDPNSEISITDACKIEPDFEVGEDVSEEVKIESFGRRAVTALKQNLASKIMDLQKDGIYKKYKDRVGDIVNGEVYQIWKKEILLLDDEGNELVLPRTDQIPSDYFKKGDMVRAVVTKVDMRNNSPIIFLSRTSPAFLERLFESEVPEIFDGLITVKNIVREPGERAKVAVESYDDRIDPVGACVGMKGSRIHGIVRELKNENIDVINFTTNIELYIQRALSPARISNMKLDNENNKADVFLRPDQVSLAIGKGGFNIRLASKLTGFEIDVYRESSEDVEDVDLEEFSDEIDHWILDQLKSIGLDTAKSVLQLNKEDLMKRADLEEGTVEQVLNVLKAEFED
ncbi:MAG: transcription termination/antitermination protein NusA [Crocinitomicaceae bacterium]|nr:transcription termination/antitermination protein NusA [Crocinitomicaceae bacterium]|tara:strand:- start:60131 stop:61369 length:1239 start_codon:yes stop_codon:yes gene_type:complete